MNAPLNSVFEGMWSCVTCCCPGNSNSLVSRITSFICENRGSAFLGATIITALVLSPQMLTFTMAMDIFVSGIFTSCAIQIIATVLGKSGLGDSASGERLAALMGVANLCVLYLQPMFGLGTAIYNGAIGSAVLLVRSNWSVPQTSEAMG